MIGRGFLRNPFLLKQLHEFEQIRETSAENNLSNFTPLKQFHHSLLEGYKDYLSGDTPVLFKMKELWFYMRDMFPEDEKLYKKIKKAKNLLEYENIVDSVL